MNPTEANDLQQQPLLSDADIEERVDALIGPACRRQWWMLFLDENHCQTPLVMPMADYPSTPNGGAAGTLAERIAEILQMTSATQVIFVWERLGNRNVSHHDRSWARALGASCAAIGVPVRAQLISHDDGVRWMAPDDYV